MIIKISIKPIEMEIGDISNENLKLLKEDSEVLPYYEAMILNHIEDLARCSKINISNIE